MGVACDTAERVGEYFEAARELIREFKPDLVLLPLAPAKVLEHFLVLS